MGKRRVHVIAVPKTASWLMLLALSVAMALLVYALSGKAYAGETHALREMLSRLFGSGRASLTRGALLAFLMPVIANVLLFVPWGFLAFVAIDRPERARRGTYGLTLVLALAFAAAMHVWQQFLPTRVTTLYDALANGAGAVAGAALGHARKSVRVRFEI